MNHKAQFTLQSLGENKTGNRAEHIFFSTNENFKKFHICLHWFLYLSDNVLLGKVMLVRYQLFITFMLCYCL